MAGCFPCQPLHMLTLPYISKPLNTFVCLPHLYVSCFLLKSHRCYLSLRFPYSPLFQVLAVSDIVVYRTRAERLHNDMFQFLSSASGAYLKHFTPELRALSTRCGLDVPLSCLGPAIIVFQETTHTQLLGHGRGRNKLTY